MHLPPSDGEEVNAEIGARFPRIYLLRALYIKDYLHETAGSSAAGSVAGTADFTDAIRTDRLPGRRTGGFPHPQSSSYPTEFPCRSVMMPWIQRVANRGRQWRVKTPRTRRKLHSRSPSHPCMSTKDRGRNPQLNIHAINDAHPCFGLFSFVYRFTSNSETTWLEWKLLDLPSIFPQSPVLPFIILICDFSQVSQESPNWWTRIIPKEK